MKKRLETHFIASHTLGLIQTKQRLLSYKSTEQEDCKDYAAAPTSKSLIKKWNSHSADCSTVAVTVAAVVVFEGVLL